MPTPIVTAVPWRTDYTLPGKAQAVTLIKGTGSFGPVSRAEVRRASVDLQRLPHQNVLVFIVLDSELMIRDTCGTTLYLRPGDTGFVPATHDISVGALHHSAVYAVLSLPQASCNELHSVVGYNNQSYPPALIGLPQIQSVCLHLVRPGAFDHLAEYGNPGGALVFGIRRDSIISVGHVVERLNQGGRLWAPAGVAFAPTVPAEGSGEAQVLVIRLSPATAR
jgi:hypothetical protein